MIRSILFDFGGTLDTDGIHWSEKFWDIYQQLYIPVSKGEFEEAYVAAEAKISLIAVDSTERLAASLQKQAQLQIDHLCERGRLRGSKNPSDMAEKIARGCYEDVIANIGKVTELLKTLVPSYNLGLISNFTGNLAEVCSELGIRKYFKVIVDSSVVGVSKPDPQIFKIAMDRLGERGAHCLMVGDSYDRDIVPAKSFGCATVLLLQRTWREPESIEAADYRIRSIAELPAILQEINRGR